MNRSKLTMNALLLIVFFFSLIAVYFTVKAYDMGEHAFLITDYQPIEGTDLSIRYSTKDPSGIYRGPQYDDELMLEGDFGFDQGTTYSEGKLYLNEYYYSDADLVFCDAVCVDTDTFEKTVIMENAMLRGCCGSGELVCVGDCLLAANKPKTSSLCRLYGMTSKIDPLSDSITVLYIDPASGEVVYRAEGEKDLEGKEFDARWINRTLEEVRQ